MRAAARWRRRSLGAFDLVPYFVVFRAAGNVLPEVNAVHVLVRIVEVQALALVGTEKLRSGGGRPGGWGGAGAPFFPFFFPPLFHSYLSALFSRLSRPF